MLKRYFPLALMDWYIGRQLLFTILFAVLLFSVIWLAPETLFKLTQYFFSGQISLPQATSMFLLHIPQVLPQTIPIAVLLGTIVLFQRLSQNYEVVALLASGISLRRILRSVLYIGLLFGLFHAVVNELIIPNSAGLLEKNYTQAGLKDIPDRNFLFVEKNHQNRLSKFFLIGQIQKPQLSDFIILYYNDAPGSGVQISRIIRASSGRWMANRHQWELQDGIEYVLDDEGVYQDVRPFAYQQVRTDQYAPILLDYTRLNPMSMPWGQLRHYIKLLREGGQLQEVPYFEVRSWQKFSAPVATVIFALLGALLGIERIRSNRVYGLLYGVVVVFFYSILVPFSGSIGSLEVVAPWLVAWIPLIAAVLITLLLQWLRPTQG